MQMNAGKRLPHRKGFIVSMLAFLTIFVTVMGFMPQEANAASQRAAMDKSSVSDSSSMDTWQDIVKDTTQYVGRIWTDKTVSDKDINLEETGEAGSSKITVRKGEGSDFLIGLSALSSTSNLKVTVERPLDIVLVLDESGSMADSVGGSPVYADDLDKSKTYYLSNGTSVKWESKPLRGDGWYDDGLIFSSKYQPKTSADDSNDDHVQFYESRQTKREQLQAAANAFIDQTAVANGQISDEKMKHRVGIVTYSRSADIENSLTNCEGEGQTDLKKTISNLQASGGTYSDEGMDEAKTVMKNARADAQQIVIFFTDGEPGGGNGVDAGTANATISAAGDLKTENNAFIYSVGIFSGADEDDLTMDTNRFMQAVSSNYPDATGYNIGNMGNPVEESKRNYYKTTKESGSLEDVFNSIFAEITEGTGFPTQVKGDDPAEDGYVTFTDKLGNYMQVDDFNTIIYADQVFEQVSDSQSGDTVTYVFRGENTHGVGNPLYPEADLSDIKITVTKGDGIEGDTVEVKIPAALIPLRQFNVEENDEDGTISTEVTNAWPMRIFYDVSVKQEALDNLADPDSDLQGYIDANSNDEGKVSFYSNDYTKGEASGNTTVNFTPASTNRFYFYTEDTYLYTDRDCKTKLDKEPLSGETYWYQRTYYDSTKDTLQTEAIQVSGANLTKYSEAVKSDISGKYYIEKGTPRIHEVTDTVLDKTAVGGNKTNTATQIINPKWDKDDVLNAEDINVYLGNNGRLDVELPGQLTVKKEVTADDGLTAPEDAEFTFKLEFTGGDSDKEYAAKIFDSKGQQTAGSLNKIKSGETFKLKAGESLSVYGLDKGMGYTVEEVKGEIPEGFTQVFPVNDSGAASSAAGTIAAGDNNEAVFVNNYSVEEKTVRLIDLGLTGTKTLNGRLFKEGDSFTFKLQQQDKDDSLIGKPLECEIKGEDHLGKNKANISFGTDIELTFTEEGSYKYMAYEELPSSLQPGITYDNTNYRLTFDVKDDGSGHLQIRNLKIEKGHEGKDWETMYFKEDGTYPGAGEHFLNFTNTYAAGEQSITIAGQKNMNNKNLQDYTESEQFAFSIEAAGVRDIDTQGAFDTSDLGKQPMPAEGAGGKYIYRNLTNGDITIPGTTFKTENIDKEYKYVIRELQPTKDGTYEGEGLTNADKNSNGEWVYNGVTFDKSEKIVIVKVKAETDPEDSAKLLIKTELVDENGDLYQYFRFNNTYNASTALSLEGEKNITGRDFKTGDSFTFEVEGVNGAPLPSGVTKTSGNKGTISIDPSAGKSEDIIFGDITFTQKDVADGTRKEEIKDGKKIYTFTKTFTYKVKELGTDANGMTYDKSEKTVKITVTDDSHGNMEAKLSDDSQELQWTNEYRSSMDYGNEAGGLEVTKTLTGRSMKAGEFGFAITASDSQDGNVSKEDADKLLSNSDKIFNNTSDRNSGVSETMKKLSGIKFTHENAGKTYKFTVKESIGDSGGVKYDKSEFEVAIAVKDNGDGSMHTITTVTKVKDADGNEIQNPKGTEYDSSKDQTPRVDFNNSYSVDPVSLNLDTRFTKSLLGRDWTDTDSFNFKLEGVTGNEPMPQKSSVITVDYQMAKDQDKTEAEDRVSFGFGEIEFTTAGTYTYKVTEDQTGSGTNGLTYDSKEATITVNVSDKDGIGKLTATPQVTHSNFENIYSANMDYAAVGGIQVTKTLNNQPLEADKFEFTITAEDNATMKKLGMKEMTGSFANEAGADAGVPAVVAQFSNLTFDESDIDETYSFSVKENTPEGSGYEDYDKAEYNVSITVSDNKDGTLKTVTVVEKDAAVVKTVEWDSNTQVGQEPIKLAFTNKYNAKTPDDNAVSLSGTKTLNGRKMADKEFSFRVRYQGTSGDDGILAKGTNNAEGKITFDKSLSYSSEQLTKLTQEGRATFNPTDDTYTVSYTAEELTEGLSDKKITVNKGSVDFTVKVKDNKDGTLTATAYGADKLDFENTYGANADKISVNINGSKILDADAALTKPDIKEAFTFTLKGEDGAPMPDDTTVKNDENGNVDFGTVNFEADDLEEVEPDSDGARSKTFTYTVSESGKVDGVTNDSQSKTLKITLKDDGKGGLTAEREPKDGAAFTFTNIYSVTPTDSSLTGDGGIKITKNIDGRDLNKGEFIFELVDANNKVVAKAVNDENGNVSFPKITYDRPGDISYTVREQNNNLGGVSYDDKIVTVIAHVKDDAKGGLSVTFETADGENKIEFNNTYEAKGTSAAFGASKQFVNGTLQDGQFEFVLKDKEGNIVSSAKNDSNGQILFEAIDYDKADTYEYTIAEIKGDEENVQYDDTVYNIKAEVTDNKNGSLEVKVTGADEAVFVNTYDKTSGSGTKTGDDMPIAVIGAVMIAAAGAGVVTIRRKIRR